MKKEFLTQLAELFYPLAEVALYEDQTWKEIHNPLSTKKEPPGNETGLFFDEARQLKILRIPTEKGFIEISFNISIFQTISEKLAPLLETKKSPSIISPRERVHQTVQEFLTKNQITLTSMNRSLKRKIIFKLYQHGLFDIKDGSKIIADVLQLSRSTIYNYLSWAQSVKKVHIHQVDTFTDVQFGGNPAGVVLEAGNLDDDTMRKIAREMNLSETSFVLPSDKGDFYFRYFTPSGDEVIFCGHSTVGALHMIVHDKEPGHYTYKVETQAGLLNMEATVSHDASIQVAYEAPKIQLSQSTFTHAQIAQALNIPLSAIDTDKPVMWEETNRDLFMTIRSLKEIQKIKVDYHRAKDFSKKHKIVAFCLLTTETIDAISSAHIRCYAPAVGIPEDPFTGSVQGGLAVYLTKNKMIPPGDIIVEQGHEMERPGSVRIHLDKGKATIHARAIHFFSTEVDLI